MIVATRTGKLARKDISKPPIRVTEGQDLSAYPDDDLKRLSEFGWVKNVEITECSKSKSECKREDHQCQSDTTKENDEKSDIDAMREECDEKGIEYHGKAGVKKLKELLAAND